MTPPRLTLKHPLSDLPGELQFTEGPECTITPTGHGGFWLIIGRVHRYIADWRVDTYVREEPPAPEHRCKVCSEQFETAHALKIHVGMKHREVRT